MTLCKSDIADNLKEKLNIILLDETDSTNNYLKELARQGEEEGTVVIADRQTGGRGRYNRKFFSPQGCGIYMSVLLKPSFKPQDTILITAAAAVAVAKISEELSGKKTEIKWVNDVLIYNKKVSGILTEGSVNPQNGEFDWAVLGIGINAYLPDKGFETEIENIAGAVFDTRQKGLRNRLIASVLNCFFGFYEDISKRTFLREYKQKSLCLGKEITVINSEKRIKAKAIDIDENCRLLVEYENGLREYLNSGEVGIKL